VLSASWVCWPSSSRQSRWGEVGSAAATAWGSPCVRGTRGRRPDVNEDTNYGRVEVRAGQKYVLKALCRTLPDDGEGRVTRHAFKFWHATAEGTAVVVSGAPSGERGRPAARWRRAGRSPCRCQLRQHRRRAFAGRLTAVIDQARPLALRVRTSARISPRVPPPALNRTSLIEGNRLATNS
jgi:hypothetical protein